VGVRGLPREDRAGPPLKKRRGARRRSPPLQTPRRRQRRMRPRSPACAHPFPGMPPGEKTQRPVPAPRAGARADCMQLEGACVPGAYIVDPPMQDAPVGRMVIRRFVKTERVHGPIRCLAFPQGRTRLWAVSRIAVSSMQNAGMGRMARGARRGALSVPTEGTHTLRFRACTFFDAGAFFGGLARAFPSRVGGPFSGLGVGLSRGVPIGVPPAPGYGRYAPTC